jgi:hypothetical protein
MKYKSNSAERRIKPRLPAMPGQMVEFHFPGVPVYQLKAKDISEIGIGVIVRSDSKFLTLFQVGQEMNVKLLTPQVSRHDQGFYKARISHITDLGNAGKFKGHKLVAVELISRISRY